MIVKNEESNILRCLKSLSSIIDYWVICDTGSSDNTKKVITDYFSSVNIPGELHEHNWVNFGHNRNKALELSKNKCDFILLCDADMELIHNKENFKSALSDLSFDLGYVNQESAFLSYDNIRLINGSKNFSYKGPTHEFISADFSNPQILKIDKDIFSFYDHASGFNRSNKFERDIDLLKKEILKEPDNQRYYFYLAQSYRDNNQTLEAIEAYKQVLEKNGFVQEKYCSCLNLGRLYKHQKNIGLSIYYFLKSIEFDNNRIEGVAECSTILRENNLHSSVCMLYDSFKNYDKNIQNILFKEKELYNNVLEFNFTISSFYSNRKEEGKKALKNVLDDERTSYIIKEQCKKNLTFYDL